MEKPVYSFNSFYGEVVAFAAAIAFAAAAAHAAVRSVGHMLGLNRWCSVRSMKMGLRRGIKIGNL